ncbi:MAG: hypothetical protein H6983_13930 [Ectothiorhodospiraceae bacterium]|nr:hypothetical protein [Ectothiorhodospiraceae bacterium]
MSTEGAPDGNDSAAVPRTTLGTAFRFFLPLMFMAELMMISHAVITAFLARMPDPEPVIAAYSISFHFHATLGSPVWACQIVAISFIRDRASMRHLLRFSLQVAASITWFWFLVGLTPLGDWFFTTLFGASPEVAAAAKVCMLVAFLIIPCAIFRSLAYALMMVKRRTMLVTYGTLIRLACLFGILAVLTLHVDGAVVGILALFGCIAIETVYSVIVARRFYRELPEQTAPLPAYRELWRFSWPIMMMQGTESGVAFTINSFLGRLPAAELALAGFGVLDSLLRVLLSPLRNLTHTTQTLVRERADLRVLVVFGIQIGAAFSLGMLMLQVPAARDWILHDVMGLRDSLADYVAPALVASAVLAACMASAAVARGLLIASRNTGAIAVASVARLAAVALVGALALLLDIDNGALIGVLALTGAFATEGVLLTWRLRRLDQGTPRLFES